MKRLFTLLSAVLLISTGAAHAGLILESEPNNTLATANKTDGLGFLEATGQLNPSGGDVDFFSFAVLATGKVELDVYPGRGEPEPSSQLVRVTLALVDASGITLGMTSPVSQTGGGFGFTYGPPFEPALSPGIYYVELSSLALTGPNDQFYYLQIYGDELTGGAKIAGTATPEPSSLALASIAGVLGLAYVWRRARPSLVSSITHPSGRFTRLF